jgi:hypothetical protein
VAAIKSPSLFASNRPSLKDAQLDATMMMMMMELKCVDEFRTLINVNFKSNCLYLNPNVTNIVLFKL